MDNTSTTPVRRKRNSITLNPPSRHNHEWTSSDRKLLSEMLEKGSSTKQVAEALGRTIPSVWSQKCQMLKEGTLKTGEKRFLSSRETGTAKAVSQPIETIQEKVETPVSPATSTPTVGFLESILATLGQYGLSATLKVEGGKLKSIDLD